MRLMMAYFFVDETVTGGGRDDAIGNVVEDGLQMGQHVVLVGGDGICVHH